MTFADVVRFDKKREQEYSQFSLKQDASDLRFIAAIVIVVLTGLTLVDLFRGTDFRVVFFVRLLVIFAHVALLIIASQKTIGPSVLQTASFVASFILSGSYFILDRYGSMPQYFFTNGIVIVNFLICTVSSLRFRFSALFSVSLVVSFLLYYPTSPHSLYQKTQITNIIIGLILSIIIGFILERHKRINFSQQTQLNKIMGILSHDFVSPMNSLLALLDLSERKLLTKGEFDFQIAKLKKSISGIILSLHNLVKWSRSQISGFAPQVVSIEVKSVVEEVIQTLHTLAADKGINIECDLKEGLHCKADSEILKLILRNVISNAIKFSYESGVIHISSTQSNGNYVCLSIRDHGAGMTEEKVKTLFTTKTRSMHGTRDEVGTGIGLYISHELVQLNKGYVKVESAKERGTTMQIYFPSLNGGIGHPNGKS